MWIEMTSPVLLFPLFLVVAVSQDVVTKDFCNMETFNVTCGIDEVLLMTGARFGRMRTGRCAKKDLGYMGCAVDVLNILDQKCSGRQQCSFKVPDNRLHQTMPCPEDITPYLEASYKCIRVYESKNKKPPRCLPNTPIPLTGQSGYISSSLTSIWNVGTHHCPWEIQVSAGQRINFTIFNFNSGLVNSGEDDPLLQPDICYEYATIKEDGAMLKRVSLCGGERRSSRLYTSRKNTVTVSVVNPTVLDSLGPFLLKYEAIGCPDLEPPVGGLVSRKGDNATVTCQSGHEIWYLTCKGSYWQGQMGNCTKSATSSSVFDQTSDFPLGILLVVAIGVALGVFLGGLLLVLAVIYMKRRNTRYQNDMYHHPDSMQPHPPYPEQKSAMMINIHSDGSPHWDHISKSLDSEDTLIRDPNCRTCSIPYCQHLVPLGPPPLDRPGNITGPGGMPRTDSNINRHHIYECPKFS